MIAGFERYAKKTKRALFLEEMGSGSAVARVVRVDQAVLSEGRQWAAPVGVEWMLQIYFLQHWFNLSDLAVEEALHDSAVLR